MRESFFPGLGIVSTLAYGADGLLSAVGDRPIPFTITGTSSDPVFRPDLKAVAKEQMKSIGSDVGKAAGGLLRDFLGSKK